MNEIQGILEHVRAIMLTHLMVNDDAMKATHALGYNGWKRMHRTNVRCFTDLHMGIENIAMDKHRIMLDAKVGAVSYKPANMKDHLMKWDDLMGQNLQELGQLQNAYRDHTGGGCCIITMAMKRMGKQYEKTGRWIKRFNESSWGSHDLHEVDDRLHNKLKLLEESGWGYDGNPNAKN